MKTQKKVKRLVALAVALLLIIAIIPAVPVYAEGNGIRSMPAEYVNLFIEQVTNQIKHISFMQEVEWVDEEILTHVLFVLEGAMLEDSDLIFSGLYFNYGFSDLQFYDEFFSGDYSQDSFSFTSDYSPAFYIGGFEFGTLNNFVDEPLSLNHFINIGFDEIGTWDDGWSPIISYEDGYYALVWIFVIDEETAALITGGDDTEAPTPTPQPTPVPTPPTGQATAPNVAQASSWARNGINEAFALGLIPEGLQSNYRQATTRAEFAALAVALYETVTGQEIEGRTEFNDTTDVNVQKMGYLGVVSGVGSGNFAPNTIITREQAAVLLARLADAIGQPLAPSASTFADNNSLSSWAVDGVGQMQASGVMGGVGNNRFNPRGEYTREQSIITMLRLFELLD